MQYSSILQGFTTGPSGFCGCVREVSEERNSSRSLVKPSLHVGKQIAGFIGGFASSGIAGRCGGKTAIGGEGSGVIELQPTSSKVSRLSGISSRSNFFLSISAHPV